ncbi:hypothetical protein [Roseibacillus persicicus]|uniref:TRAM domain-containing protein n=1 Tax=Roseibacillus persicicus TaxID=454148 RepID=A0A918TMB2_9BACT|nr:hypothetical protein [Roseibacillus persicicus]MDQ8189407.1 hypothetical protein [Roseibacillus persicicus]GHC55547.1 hypothetical protein GCM10007100_22700 [Roseibacillus persicicus]
MKPIKILRSPSSVNVARLGFLLLCLLTGVALHYGFGADSDARDLLPISSAIGGALVIAFLLIWVETLIRDVSLREFSTGTFGLAVGVFCGWLLTQLKVEEVLFKLIEVNAGADSPYMDSSVLDLITLAFRVVFIGGMGFIASTLALRSGKEDFAFVVPYVRFRQDGTSGAPIVVDREAVLDGRIESVMNSGFLAGRVVVPRMVLDDLQNMVDSPEAHDKQRAQRALDALARMKSDGKYRLTVHEHPANTSTDDPMSQLVRIAQMLAGRVLTVSDEIARIAEVQGVDVLNLHELVEALKPRVVVGQQVRLALVRSGRDEHQAVGYLADGTMIVVNNAASRLGSTQDVVVISKLETTSGEMVFAELA